MAKIQNKEQETQNKERLVDIVLILQYMKSLDVNNEFFTDKGEGFIEGLASVKDEIAFVDKELYEICDEDRCRLLRENLRLKEQLISNKKKPRYWL